MRLKTRGLSISLALAAQVPSPMHDAERETSDCVCVSTRQYSPQKNLKNNNRKKSLLKNCLSFDIFSKEPKVVKRRCFPSQSRVLCAGLMKTLLNKDTEGAIIAQFDG